MQEHGRDEEEMSRVGGGGKAKEMLGGSTLYDRGSEGCGAREARRYLRPFGAMLSLSYLLHCPLDQEEMQRIQEEIDAILEFWLVPSAPVCHVLVPCDPMHACHRMQRTHHMHII